MNSAQINMISVWREDDSEDACDAEQGLVEIISLSPRNEDVQTARESVPDRNAGNDRDTERYTRWKIGLFFVGMVISIIGIVLLGMAAMSYATHIPVRNAPLSLMDTNGKVLSDPSGL